MLQSDTDIKLALASGTIVVDGLSVDAIQPASIDLHLSKWFRRFHKQAPNVDPKEEASDTELIECFNGVFMVNPHEFVLASCVERIELSASMAGRIEGKSSLGRLGLLVHTTAGFFDPGFKGHPTLELVNMRSVPFILYPDMKIAQMSFFRTESPATIPYGRGVNKYQDQGPEPVTSKYYLNFR